jgi:osmoprotectant transport system permease protein
MVSFVSILKKICLIVLLLFLTALFFIPSFMEGFLSGLFPSLTEVVYPRATLLEMSGEHLRLVAVSSFFAIITGLTGGILVTRKSGLEFLPIVQDSSSLAQTFPPVAVLALIVPLVGFGFTPAVVALVLYSILPVLNNTISGLNAVSPDIEEAARGMGMSPRQVLFKVELPIAAPVIMGGIRTSVIINVGTATLGSIVGAGGLGAPIVSGLVRNNNAFVFQGALATAILALTLDRIFAYLERRLY